MRGMDLLKWKKLLTENMFRYKYVLLVILAGMVLLLLPPLWGENETTEGAASQSEETDTVFSTEELETRLEEILSQIQGVGETQVVLTLKSGPQDILAKDVDTSIDERGTQSELSSLVLSQAFAVPSFVASQALLVVSLVASQALALASLVFSQRLSVSLVVFSDILNSPCCINV